MAAVEQFAVPMDVAARIAVVEHRFAVGRSLAADRQAARRLVEDKEPLIGVRRGFHFETGASQYKSGLWRVVARNAAHCIQEDETRCPGRTLYPGTDRGSVPHDVPSQLGDVRPSESVY